MLLPVPGRHAFLQGPVVLHLQAAPEPVAPQVYLERERFLGSLVLAIHAEAPVSLSEAGVARLQRRAQRPEFSRIVRGWG
jgi:hypothetical protein